MALTFSQRLKHSGNTNRLHELHSAGCTAEEARDCFARGGMTLKVVQGDFPLMGNLSEFTRAALPKQVVQNFLRERRMPSGMASTNA
jgi:hypothetical protein